jgi:hypothetical protein
MGLFQRTIGRLHEHGKRGDGITHKFARLVTGDKAGPRSPHWPTIEHRWRKGHPACAACGSLVGVQVHHLAPFHLNKDLELWDCSGIPPGTGPVGGTPNFISLCEEGVGDKEHHHYVIGHSKNWKGWNPNALTDAADMFAHPQNGPAIIARALASGKV